MDKTNASSTHLHGNHCQDFYQSAKSKHAKPTATIIDEFLQETFFNAIFII